MFLSAPDTLLRIAVVSTLAYVAFVVVLRFAGKRSLSKLNVFDFVVTVAFGSTLATVLLSKDVSLAEGVLAFAMLAGLQYLVSRLSVTSARFKRLVRSEPALLVIDGQILHDALARERVTRGEVEAAARSKGIGRLEDIAALILETDGSFSVIGRAAGPLNLLGDVRR